MSIRSHKYVIVPAAGIGIRMGLNIPKQYLKFSNNKTILDITLEKLIKFNFFDKIILVLNKNDSFWQDSHYFNNSKIIICKGGGTRFESVYNALKQIQKDCQKDDWIFVHDVVRPCICFQDIKKLHETVSNLKTNQCGILAIKVAETVKEAKIDNITIDRTLNRDYIWLAQTPQLSKFDLLCAAFQYCEDNNLVEKVVDEASALELYGVSPTIVQGSKTNFKITIQEDLELANLFI